MVFLIKQGFVLSESAYRDTLIFIAMIIQEIIIIAIVVIAWKLLQKKTMTQLGLPSIKQHGKAFLLGAGLGFLAISFVFLIFYINGNVSVITISFHTDLITYLILFTLAGFAEEMFGRGYIMGVLAQTKSVPMMVFISSAIFAFLPSGNPGFNGLALLNL